MRSPIVLPFFLVCSEKICSEVVLIFEDVL